MILFFLVTTKLLRAMGFESSIVTAASLIIVLIGVIIGWVATMPLERLLFGDQIERIPLHPWVRVTVAVLLIIGMGLVAFETMSRYRHAETQEKQIQIQENATAERARMAEIQRQSAPSLKAIEELRRQRATSTSRPIREGTSNR